MQWKIRKYLEVSPAFVALLCAYFYFDPAETFLPFLLAVTLHEAGHLLALRCMRVQVHKVSFQLTGAVIHTQPLRYPQEGLAAAAGPLVNLLCTLVFLHKNPAFALVNLLLLFFNLLPLYPLDGGRILRALLHILLNDAAACIAEKLISGGLSDRRCGVCSLSDLRLARRAVADSPVRSADPARSGDFLASVRTACANIKGKFLKKAKKHLHFSKARAIIYERIRDNELMRR